MKKTALLLAAIIFISGCTASQIDIFLKASPLVSSFLEQYPNAKVTTILVAQGTVQAQIEKIKEDCGPDFPLASYYKTTLDDKENGIMLVIWMDSKNYQITCAVKESAGVKKEVNANETIEVTTTTQPIPTTYYPPTTAAPSTTSPSIIATTQQATTTTSNATQNSTNATSATTTSTIESTTTTTIPLPDLTAAPCCVNGTTPGTRTFISNIYNGFAPGGTDVNTTFYIKIEALFNNNASAGGINTSSGTCTTSLPSLISGSMSQAGCQIYISTKGSYTFITTVDSTNVIAESNENSNVNVFSNLDLP